MTVEDTIKILSALPPKSQLCVKQGTGFPYEKPDIDEVTKIENEGLIHYKDSDGLEQWGPVVSLIL